jgi:hypothetical protein
MSYIVTGLICYIAGVISVMLWALAASGRDDEDEPL